MQAEPSRIILLYKHSLTKAVIPLKDENPHPPGFKPKMTIILIISNAVVFLIQIMITGQFFDFVMLDQNQLYPNTIHMYYSWGAVPNCITGGDSLFLNFGAGPETIQCPDNPYITLLSSTFMHGGLMHFGGNMLFLWVFGDNIEQKFGKFKYLFIYLGWGVVAGLVHVFGDASSPIPAVGASGAISGILGAYLVIFPRARILTFVGYFMMHIQARWFLPFWLILQNLLPYFIGGFGASGGGVAFLAHIGGFVIGLATGIVYKKMHRDDSLYGNRYGYRPDY